MVVGMKFISLLALFSATSGVVTAYPARQHKRAGDPQTSLSLDPSQVQKGLEQDGSKGQAAAAGQTPSETSPNNLWVLGCSPMSTQLLNVLSIASMAVWGARTPPSPSWTGNKVVSRYTIT